MLQLQEGFSCSACDHGQSSISLSQLLRPIPTHLCLQHPHILQLLEVFLTDEFLAISTQYAAGGDLAEFVAARCQRDSVTALPEAQARYLFQQLIIAVDFCHQVSVLTCIRSVRFITLLCTEYWQDACCCGWMWSSRPPYCARSCWE